MEQNKPSIVNRFLHINNIFTPYVNANPRRSLKYVKRIFPLKCNPQEG